MTFRKYIVILFSLFLFHGAFAQMEKKEAPKYIDVVKLRGGVEFRGKITKYLHNVFVVLKLADGQEYTFNMKDVKRITQEPLNEAAANVVRLKVKEYKFKEKGWYGSVNLGALGGSAAGEWSSNRLVGLDLSIAGGFQFNRWLGVGLGVGANSYYPNSGEGIFPFFVEARGYLKEANISPYYAVSTGYGFSLYNNSSEVIESKGGVMVHPAFGFRFGGSSNMTFTLDFGLRLQKANYTRPNWNWRWQEVIEDTIEHKMFFKRFNFRVGVLF